MFRLSLVLLLSALLAACGEVTTPSPAPGAVAGTPTFTAAAPTQTTAPTAAATATMPAVATQTRPVPATPTALSTPATSPTAAAPGATPSAAANGDGHEVVFSIPVGDEGVHYRGVDQPEMRPDGPAGFAVAPDGTFWVIDTAEQRLLHYDRTGTRLGIADLQDQKRALVDIVVTGDSILLLDADPTPPLILELDPEGTLKASYALPEEYWLPRGLTGIGLDEEGRLLIELQFGGQLARGELRDGRVDATTLPGYSRGGVVYTAHPADMQQEDATTGYLMFGEKRVEVKVRHALGGLTILGFKPDGSIYVRLDEVYFGQAFQVDQTVRRYSVDGEVLGMARVPLDQRLTYVQNGLDVGPDGEVYAFMTMRDQAEIWRLLFTPELEPVLPGD